MKTEFYDGELSIRRYGPGDAPAIYEAVRESIEQLCQWMPWCKPTYSMEDTLWWTNSRDAAWEKKEEYSFIIIEQKTDRLLGAVGLNRIEVIDHFASLGYWVRTSETRKGIGARAARLAARFGFAEAGLNHIQILTEVNNIASQRVVEKIGARRECILRKRLFLHEEARDAVLFSLVEEDLK